LLILGQGKFRVAQIRWYQASVTSKHSSWSRLEDLGTEHFQRGFSNRSPQDKVGLRGFVGFGSQHSQRKSNCICYT